MSEVGMAKAYIGCSGWSYQHWRGVFYPPQLPAREWFPYYSKNFATVEVNSTFYRLPPRSTFELWARQAPAGFIFALKVSRYGTHRLKLKHPGQWLPNHLDRAGLLGSALGPNLVQLPPRWRRDLPRLTEFLEVAKELGSPAKAEAHGAPGPPAKAEELAALWAVEFRDPSWLDDSTYELLARYGAALCCHDLLPDHPWVRTASWAYARFHGPSASRQPYTGDYGRPGLAKAAAVLGGWLGEGSDIYAYFNNDEGGSAVRDAKTLANLLGQLR
jgi:uncharacterized protein YecE (DUF72 family)